MCAYIWHRKSTFLHNEFSSSKIEVGTHKESMQRCIWTRLAITSSRDRAAKCISLQSRTRTVAKEWNWTGSISPLSVYKHLNGLAVCRLQQWQRQQFYRYHDWCWGESGPTSISSKLDWLLSGRAESCNGNWGEDSAVANLILTVECNDRTSVLN